MAQQQRQVAKITTTKELNSGKYFQKEGFEPNYLLTPEGKRLSRARIAGTLVDKFINEDETYGSLTIDDSKDTIQIKFFNELDKVKEFEVGDILEVVGKVREYQGEIYLNGEILRERELKKELLHQLKSLKQNEKWNQLRKTVKQLKESGKSQEEIEKEMKRKLTADEIDALLQSFGENFDNEKTEEAENLERKVLEAVEELDTGDGADYADISEEVEGTEEKLEETINNLLSEGTCYEPKPGKIKKL